MSLLASASGHLSNLSTVPFDAVAAVPCGETIPEEPEEPEPDDGDDHGNTRATATRVTAPSTTAGNLEAALDRDYFRFELPSSGRLRVYSTGGTDTVGTLYRGSSRITSNDDGGGCRSRIDTKKAS